MALEMWIPEGIEEEYTITVSGKSKTLYAFPYKWYTVEAYNAGPDEVKVMTNKTPLPKAITLDERQTREFGTEKKPTIWRVVVRAEAGKSGTVKITTRR